MKKRSNYRAFLLIWSVLCILTSCKVVKDSARPEIKLPLTYRNAGLDSSLIAKIPWQSFFQDSLLKVLIADALNYNNDLLVAVKNIETSSLVLKQARLGNYPNLNFQTTVLSNRPSDNSLNGLTLYKFLDTKHVEDYSTGPFISWEADLWGKISSQKAAALAAFLQTEEARKGLQTQIISNISKSYYNLLMLDSQLDIAKKNVLLNDSTLSIIRLQFQAGQVTSLAVQQVEAQKLTAARLIPEFERQIIMQENAISILCGKNPVEISRKNSLETLQVTEAMDAGLPPDLLSNRPDVRLAELGLEKANARVGYAKAAMYPSLVITAQTGLDAFKGSNWFNIPASLFGAVAGSISQPLFQQRRFRTQYELALVNREQSVLEFRQSVLTAVGEVSDALIKIVKYRQQQLLLLERTSILQRATYNSRLLFGNGLASYLEVITAQGTVLESELELASIKKARLDATVDLYRSVGGGWN